MKRLILGVTGASGAIYAARTLKHLKALGHSVFLIETKTGKSVAEFEGFQQELETADLIYDNDDFFLPPASGSASFEAMAIVPCSMGTLGKIATGISDNLLLRAADVCLKEKRPLVIVPREMPYNLIHLKNMERASLAGTTIVPASPHFYSHPQSVEEIVDTVVAKILSHLGIPHSIVPPWGENLKP